MIPDFISKQRKTRLELLGWYQIVGGIAGVLVTFWILSKTEQITWVIALLFYLHSHCTVSLSIAENYSWAHNIAGG